MNSEHLGLYMYVKFERVIINSVPLMDINANLHLTLKLEVLKVKVKDKGRNGKCSWKCICMWSLKKLSFVVFPQMT